MFSDCVPRNISSVSRASRFFTVATSGDSGVCGDSDGGDGCGDSGAKIFLGTTPPHNFPSLPQMSPFVVLREKLWSPPPRLPARKHEKSTKIHKIDRCE
jgi:hypothetical protein